MIEFNEKKSREYEIMSLKRVLNNAVSKKHWLVAIFIRLFFSMLIRHAIDIQREKFNADTNKQKSREKVKENPFLYRMR